MRFSASKSTNRRAERFAFASLAIAALAVLAGCSSANFTGPAKRARTPGTLFSADTTLSVGQAPWALALADFDGDGSTDIAVACLDSRSVQILFNGPDGAIFHKKTDQPSADTTITFDSGFRPRLLRVSDVNGDGRPDLVIGLEQDSISVGLDRVVVLLNEGTRPGALYDTLAYNVGFDGLVGHGIRDLYLGDIDGNGSVDIVGATADSGDYPVVLLRAARRADLVNGTINVVGKSPADGATDVSLRSPVTITFDENSSTTIDTTTFVPGLRDSGWVTLSGSANGGPASAIPTELHTYAQTVNGIYTFFYEFDPVGVLPPDEVVTVTVSKDLHVQAKLPSTGVSTPQYTDLKIPSQVQWSFTTEGNRISASFPPNGAIDVMPDAPVRLGFTYPVDGGTLAGAIRLIGQNGDIPFTAQYDPDSVLATITPKTPFLPYENLQVVVDASLLDSTGRATFSPDTVSFRAVGPLVQSVTPSGAVAYMNADSTIHLRFTAKMAAPDNNALVVIGDQSGAHTVSAMTLDPDGYGVTATVQGAFLAGEWVTAVATEGFVSAGGGYPLARPYAWRFVARPSVASTFTQVTPTAGSDLWGGTVAGGIFARNTTGIVLASLTGTIGLLSDAESVFIRKATVEGVPGLQTVRAADLNGDGLLDLVTAPADSDFVKVMLNTTGTGSTITFGDTARYDVGVRPVAVWIGDVNGDGAPDIVTANVSSDDISVLINNGDGTFGKETYYVVGTNPVAVAGADLDGNGTIDLVVANSTGNSITLLRNLTALRPPPSK